MEELTPITRKETFLAKAAGQEVETPAPVTREEVFLDAIAKGGGSSLPAVTSADNGSELIVKNGAWAKQQKKFIVTLTPTALDYSGTMDKTVAEINAAYEAGQEILFSLSDGTLTYNSPANLIVDAGSGVVIFNAQLIDTTKNLVLCISTNYSDGGDTYSTYIYSLTPAS